jgi:type II secretory pathway pseudopilin PulG
MLSPIEKQKFSIIETIILTSCIFILIFALIFGVLVQARVNEDKVRIRNIMSITKVLEQYYNDSSSVEYARRYPVSQCSTTEPNSIDYEHTLYTTLTGIDKNTFKYIEGPTFPQDARANYTTISDNTCIKESERSQYSKNNKGCNYQPTEGRNFCYLYSTSSTGDRYTLAFFSDSKNKLVSVSRLRDNNVNIGDIDLTLEEVK